MKEQNKNQTFYINEEYHKNKNCQEEFEKNFEKNLKTSSEPSSEPSSNEPSAISNVISDILNNFNNNPTHFLNNNPTHSQPHPQPPLNQQKLNQQKTSLTPNENSTIPNKNSSIFDEDFARLISLHQKAKKLKEKKLKEISEPVSVKKPAEKTAKEPPVKPAFGSNESDRSNESNSSNTPNTFDNVFDKDFACLAKLNQLARKKSTHSKEQTERKETMQDKIPLDPTRPPAIPPAVPPINPPDPDKPDKPDEPDVPDKNEPDKDNKPLTQATDRVSTTNQVPIKMIVNLLSQMFYQTIADNIQLQKLRQKNLKTQNKTAKQKTLKKYLGYIAQSNYFLVPTKTLKQIKTIIEKKLETEKILALCTSTGTGKTSLTLKHILNTLNNDTLNKNNKKPKFALTAFSTWELIKDAFQNFVHPEDKTKFEKLIENRSFDFVRTNFENVLLAIFSPKYKLCPKGTEILNAQLNHFSDKYICSQEICPFHPANTFHPANNQNKNHTIQNKCPYYSIFDTIYQTACQEEKNIIIACTHEVLIAFPNLVQNPNLTQSSDNSVFKNFTHIFIDELDKFIKDIVTKELIIKLPIINYHLIGHSNYYNPLEKENKPNIENLLKDLPEHLKNQLDSLQEEKLFGKLTSLFETLQTQIIPPIMRTFSIYINQIKENNPNANINTCYFLYITPDRNDSEYLAPFTININTPLPIPEEYLNQLKTTLKQILNILYTLYQKYYDIVKILTQKGIIRVWLKKLIDVFVLKKPGSLFITSSTIYVLSNLTNQIKAFFSYFDESDAQIIFASSTVTDEEIRSILPSKRAKEIVIIRYKTQAKAKVIYLNASLGKRQDLEKRIRLTKLLTLLTSAQGVITDKEVKDVLLSFFEQNGIVTDHHFNTEGKNIFANLKTVLITGLPYPNPVSSLKYAASLNLLNIDFIRKVYSKEVIQEVGRLRALAEDEQAVLVIAGGAWPAELTPLIGTPDVIIPAGRIFNHSQTTKTAKELWQKGLKEIINLAIEQKLSKTKFRQKAKQILLEIAQGLYKARMESTQGLTEVDARLKDRLSKGFKTQTQLIFDMFYLVNVLRTLYRESKRIAEEIMKSPNMRNFYEAVMRKLELRVILELTGLYLVYKNYANSFNLSNNLFNLPDSLSSPNSPNPPPLL